MNRGRKASGQSAHNGNSSFGAERKVGGKKNVIQCGNGGDRCIARHGVPPDHNLPTHWQIVETAMQRCLFCTWNSCASVIHVTDPCHGFCCCHESTGGSRQVDVRVPSGRLERRRALG